MEGSESHNQWSFVTDQASACRSGGSTSDMSTRTMRTESPGTSRIVSDGQRWIVPSTQFTDSWGTDPLKIAGNTVFQLPYRYATLLSNSQGWELWRYGEVRSSNQVNAAIGLSEVVPDRLFHSSHDIRFFSVFISSIRRRTPESYPCLSSRSESRFLRMVVAGSEAFVPEWMDRRDIVPNRKTMGVRREE